MQQLRPWFLLAIAAYTVSCTFRSSDLPHKLSKKESEHQLPDEGPALYARFETEMTKDVALGYVPRERLAYALEYTRQLQQSAVRDAIPGIVWTERGPDNVSGRTRAVLFDPNDPTGKAVFAGGVGGGIWKTNDITAAKPVWVPVDDLMANLAISTLAADPLNPQVLYAGTGEGWYNFDAIRGDGIFKSTNGGATWSALASTVGNPDFQYVQKIVVHPVTGHVYAATRSAASGSGGVFRSADGGATWTKVLGNGLGASSDRAADLEIAADNSIYAAMGILQTDGIYRSTTGDAGSWTKLNTGTNGFPTSAFFRCEIACAPSNASTLYVLTEQASTGGLYNIYKSTNSGSTWTTLPKPLWNDQSCSSTSNDFTRGQGWYDLIAAVDPTNANRVLIGGIDLFLSTDGGNTWTQKSSWWGGCSRPYVHADQHAIVFQPGNPNVVLFGNDGGVYRSTDGGNTFSFKGWNYNVTTYYSCAMHPNAGNHQFLAGSQDNGTQLYYAPGINTTIEALGGDGGYCHIDQDQPSYQFASYVFANIYRSSDGGNTFSSVFSNSSVGNFINPSAYDNINNVLYFNYGNPYNGTNYGLYGRIVNATTSNTVTTVNISSASGTSFFTHLTVSPNTSNRIFIGTSNGRVIRVDNANGSASATLIGTPVANNNVSCIAVQNGNDNHLLVTYSNYGVTSVWQTTNGGTTWTSVEGNLPDMPIWWVLFNPNNSDQAMLATETGVWTTDDLNGTSTIWSPASTGMPNVSTRMLQIRSSDRLVIAATHGRGLFSTDVFANPTADFFANKTVSYVGAPIQFTDASYKATSWSWNFGDATTSTVKNPVKSYSTPGYKTVTLTINNGAATVTRTNYILILPNRGTPYLAANGGNFDVNANDFGAETPYGTGWVRGNSSTSGKNGTYSGSFAWVTGLSGNYVNHSVSYLYTPNFNFSATGTYTISFYAKYNVETDWDGFRVEYSLDKGSTWNLLGTTGGSWYNYANTLYYGTAFPYGEPFFTGSTSGYVLRQFATSALQGNPNVAFRIVFRSDVLITAPGVAIDNFEILGPTNTTLPVELVTFEGSNAGNVNLLRWVTASEFNNHGFEVQRSLRADFWEVIGFVSGRGTTSLPTTYVFADSFLNDPAYYYRLRQVDFDGSAEFSPVIFLTGRSSRLFEVELATSFAEDAITLVYQNATDADLQVTLYDASGKVLRRHRQQIQQISGLVTMDLPDLMGQGMYLIAVQSGQQQRALKFFHR